MRAIAEEAFEMVRSYKGSHSGEHGHGLVRSEFHRAMFGDRMVERSEEHTSELSSLMRNSYVVFCSKKKIYRLHPDTLCVCILTSAPINNYLNITHQTSILHCVTII